MTEEAFCVKIVDDSQTTIVKTGVNECGVPYWMNLVAVEDSTILSVRLIDDMMEALDNLRHVVRRREQRIAENHVQRAREHVEEAQTRLREAEQYLAKTTD